MSTKNEVIEKLSMLHTRSTFLTLHRYRNDVDEIADYSIVFHISYKTTLEKSIAILQNYLPQGDLETQAREELIASFTKSLEKMEETPMEEQDDTAYSHFRDEDGSYIKGVKVHLETGCLHLYGLVNNKRVIQAGTYPKSNKRPLTIAKDKLRRLCPVSRWRQFKFTPEKIDSLTVSHLDLLPPMPASPQ